MKQKGEIMASAKSNSESKKQAESVLKVAEAGPKDVGRNIARIDP